VPIAKTVTAPSKVLPTCLSKDQVIQLNDIEWFLDWGKSLGLTANASLAIANSYTGEAFEIDWAAVDELIEACPTGNDIRMRSVLAWTQYFIKIGIAPTSALISATTLIVGEQK
jgi:hypothetical protein